MLTIHLLLGSSDDFKLLSKKFLLMLFLSSQLLTVLEVGLDKSISCSLFPCISQSLLVKGLLMSSLFPLSVFKISLCHLLSRNLGQFLQLGRFNVCDMLLLLSQSMCFGIKLMFKSSIFSPGLVSTLLLVGGDINSIHGVMSLASLSLLVDDLLLFIMSLLMSLLLMEVVDFVDILVLLLQGNLDDLVQDACFIMNCLLLFAVSLIKYFLLMGLNRRHNGCLVSESLRFVGELRGIFRFSCFEYIGILMLDVPLFVMEVTLICGMLYFLLLLFVNKQGLLFTNFLQQFSNPDLSVVLDTGKFVFVTILLRV